MKIFCIGDSLALPGHGNRYEDTWIYNLKIKYSSHDFITYFKRQLTTEVLITMGGGENGPDKMPKGADCLEFYNPDIVIIQLGIVDCAPRLLHGIEKRVISKLPEGIRNVYLNVIKKLRKRTVNNTVIHPKQFMYNLDTYLNRCKGCSVKKVIFIAICYPGNEMISKNPEIIDNIQHYNLLTESLKNKYPFLNIIYPLDSRKHPEQIYSDGYHPNPHGHQVVADEISKIIND